MQAARGTPLSEHETPGHTGPLGGDARPRRKMVGVLLVVAAFVLVSDVITKTLVVAERTARPPIVLLGGFLKLTELRNPGAAFSIGGPSVTILFTAIAVGVAIFILRVSAKITSRAWAVALGLLLGGAMGNLTDRIFRYPGIFRGYVVDWIQVPHWPVFNLADSAIVCGGVLAVLLALLGIGIDGRRSAQAGARETDTAKAGQGKSGTSS